MWTAQTIFLWEIAGTTVFWSLGIEQCITTLCLEVGQIRPSLLSELRKTALSQFLWMDCGVWTWVFVSFCLERLLWCVENPGKFECLSVLGKLLLRPGARVRNNVTRVSISCCFCVCVCVCCLTRSKDFLWRFGVLCRELDHLRTGWFCQCNLCSGGRVYSSRTNLHFNSICRVFCIGQLRQRKEHDFFVLFLRAKTTQVKQRLLPLKLFSLALCRRVSSFLLPRYRNRSVRFPVSFRCKALWLCLLFLDVL